MGSLKIVAHFVSVNADPVMTYISARVILLPRKIVVCCVDQVYYYVVFPA